MAGGGDPGRPGGLRGPPLAPPLRLVGVRRASGPWSVRRWRSGSAAAREAKRFGFELTAQLLQQTAATARLPGPAGGHRGRRGGGRDHRPGHGGGHPDRPPGWPTRRWPLVILAAVLLLRGGPGGAASGWAGTRSARGWSPTSRPLAIVVGFALIGVGRCSGSAGGTGTRPVVSELGDELGARRVRHRRRAGRAPAAGAGAARP